MLQNSGECYNSFWAVPLTANRNKVLISPSDNKAGIDYQQMNCVYAARSD